MMQQKQQNQDNNEQQQPIQQQQQQGEEVEELAIPATHMQSILIPQVKFFYGSPDQIEKQANRWMTENSDRISDVNFEFRELSGAYMGIIDYSIRKRQFVSIATKTLP